MKASEPQEGTVQNDARNVLALEWGLRDAVVERIHAGISSDACVVTAGEKRYVLRKLASAQQGHLEYQIAGALSEQDVTPGIICTSAGKAFAEDSGSFWQLQKFAGGSKPQNCDEELVRAVAGATAQMHKALAAIHNDVFTPDRFALSHLLRGCDWEFLQQSISRFGGRFEEFERLCNSLIPLDEEKQQWIHGDLGTWNLLFENGRVRIIDFGECRRGSIYFDLAAAITSLLANVKDQQTCAKYVCQFQRSYAEHGTALDREILFRYVQLWYIRGILVNAAAENCRTENSENMIAYFWEQKNRFMELERMM